MIVEGEAVFGPWDRRDIAAPVDVIAHGNNRFSSIVAQTNSYGTVFGGQYMGLAIEAASRTAPGRAVHAANGYFLRRGSLDRPIDIDVSQTFDGKAIGVRYITLSQQGRALFSAQASFARMEQGYDHGIVAPQVPEPDGLMSLHDLVHEGRRDVIAGLARRIALPPSIDLRPVDPVAYAAGALPDTQRMAWFRIPDMPSLGQNSRRAILAYLTDYWLAASVALIHDRGGPDTLLFMSSLNQSIWFYHYIDLAEWLLFRTDSPAAQGGRGLGRCDIFDRSGKIVASSAQEIIIRPLRGK